MNKDSDLLKCPICLDQYNLTERLPKLLPQCGHTICLECLSTLLRGHDAKCPLDKICFSEAHVELDQYPTNFSLRFLLEEDNLFDICPTHNARMEVVCFQDKVKICPFCALFSEHKTHELRYISDIQTEVNQKRKEVDAALKMRNDFQKNAENALEEKKTELLKVIEDRYELMFTALKNAKDKMTGEFNTFFEKQKDRFKEVFDRDGLIMSTLNAKSIGFRDFAKKKDPFSVLDEDVSALIPKLDNLSLEKPLQRIHDQLNDVSIYLSTILAIQPGFTAEIEAPLKKFPEKAAVVLSDNLKEDLLMQPAQIGDLPFFEVLAPFTVDTSNDIFKITAHNKLPENIQVNVEEWKKIKEAVFTLDPFGFNQKDLTWLGTMWGMLEGLTSIKLIIQPQPGLADNNVTKLLSTLFMRNQALEEISVDFGTNKVGDECVKLFLEQILPKAEKLKHISLGLVKTAVSNATMEGFCSKVLPKYKDLETFKIDLGLTGVSENTVTQMFVELPQLKKLDLGLNGLGVTDKALETLSRNVLGNARSLEDFEIKLWMSKVTDEGLSMLFSGLKDMKRLSLNLVGTSVTDKSMNVLVSSINENIKSLKDLDLYLWSTAVSEGVKGQLEEIKKVRAS